MKLTSVYNFVPLNDCVYTPDWAELVSHDAPFSDGEDGIIEVTLRNVSPLFTRNGSSDRNNGSPYSAHIETADGKKLYYLPATSLKGMFRSVMEIMSFARLSDSQYTNRFFGYRDLGGKDMSNGKKYVSKMQGVKAGWLRKKDEKLYLTPCDGDYKCIEYREIESLYPHSLYNSTDSGWKKNLALFKETGAMYPDFTDEYGEEYRIVCTGHINKKHKEFLFPTQQNDEIEVSESVKTKFYTVHEPTPDFAKTKDKGLSITEYLDDEKELAVFYLPERNGDGIEAIGLASMFRYPYKQSVKELITLQQGENDNIPDLTQTIFGYTGKEKNLKGRIQFGNAFAETSLSDDELLKADGVLGQPKASFYPFYLKQDHSPYKTYDDATAIAGRKVYRTHKGSSVSNLPQGNGQESIMTHFRPIPAGLTFHLRIAVHNLRKVEIGALLSAITLHNTTRAWHHLGLAKGFGYGKLEITSVVLKGFSAEKEEYMQAFEKEMAAFTYPKEWHNTPQSTMLMSILGEHEEDEVKMMEGFAKYKEAKNNKNFMSLTDAEKAIPVHSLLKDKDKEDVKKRTEAIQLEKKRQASALLKEKFVQENQAKYEQAEHCYNQKEFSQAIEIYKELIEQLGHRALDSSAEELRIKDIEAEKAKEDAEKERRKKEQKEKQRIEKMKAGLFAILNEKYPEGTPNAGQYKIKDFKTLMQKVNKWLKDTHADALTDDERRAVWESVDRMLPTGAHPKKEDKDVNNKDSKLWKWINDTLGEREQSIPNVE